jgi:hypothetical protein
MKTFLIFLTLAFGFNLHAQVNCDLLLSDSALVCTGEQLNLNANGPAIGLGNGGPCNYLPPGLDNPAAWYPFCGNANDESIFGNHAVISSVIPQFDRFSRYNNALFHQAEIYNTPMIRPFDSLFTFTAWIKTTHWSQFQTILDKGSYSALSHFVVRLNYDSVNNISFLQVKTGSSDTVYIETPPNNIDLADDQWHFIAVVRSLNFISLYADGNLLSQSPFTGYYPHNNLPVLFAKSWDTNFFNINYFEGIIDDAAFYQHALSISDLNALFTIVPIDYLWSTGETTAQIQISPVSDTLISVTATSGNTVCHDSIIVQLSIDMFLVADTIYGMPENCIPRSPGSAVFATDNIPGVINYQWTVPSQMTIISGQGTPQIHVQWNNAASYAGITGEICVELENSCGIGQAYCLPVDLQITAPGTPSAIMAGTLFKMCPGDTNTFSVAPKPRTFYYNWITPAGMHLISGQGTQEIEVTVDNTFTGGDLLVRSENVCGQSSYRTRNIGFNFPIQPVVGGVRNDFCHSSDGHNRVFYEVRNAVDYSQGTIYWWSWPANMDFALYQYEPADSSVVYASWQYDVAGHVSVRAHNSCGTSIPGVYGVNSDPQIPDSITGPLAVCDTALVSYTFDDDHESFQNPQYEWRFLNTQNQPVQVSNLSGATSNTVTFRWPAGLPEGKLWVRETDCGVGQPRILSGIMISSSYCGLRIAQASETLSLYPNPVSDHLMIEFESENSSQIILSVFDALGRELKSMKYSVHEGMNRLEMDCNRLASGSYVLRLQMPDGKSEFRHFHHL